MDTVRLGFVGAGMMGQLAHIANYAALPGVELVALAEGRPELARRVAARYGIAHVRASHRELAARDDLDAVVAVTWFSLHHGIVPDLLAAGKHVATEKALASTVPAGEALVEAAERAGRVYQVSYMKRFDPGVQLARATVQDWLRSGEAGALRFARIWCAHGDWTWHIEAPLRTDEPVPAYDVAPEPAQHGADEESQRWVTSQLNYYSHQTNLLRCLLGEDYQVAWLDDWSGGTVIGARTPSGVRCVLEFAAYRVPGWDEGFELRFEAGVIRGRLPAPLARQQAATIEIERARGDHAAVVRPHVPPRWAMRCQAEAFVAAVRGEGPELSPAREALTDVRLVWDLARQRGDGTVLSA